MGQKMGDRCEECGAVLEPANSSWLPDGSADGHRYHLFSHCIAALKAQLAAERRKARVRPGHHPPCPAMLDGEAVCTCGQ